MRREPRCAGWILFAFAVFMLQAISTNCLLKITAWTRKTPVPVTHDQRLKIPVGTSSGGGGGSSWATAGLATSFAFGYPLRDDEVGNTNNLRGWNASGAYDAANDLTNRGTVSFTTVNGKKCAVLNSSPDSKQLTISTTPGSIVSNTNFTLAYWFQKTTLADNGQHHLLWFGDYGSTTSDGAYLQIGSGTKFSAFSLNDDAQLPNVAHTINDTNWHHWVMTRNGNVWRFFVDGSPLGQVTNPAATVDLNGGFRIGGYFGTPSFASSARGGIYDVLVWTRALSDADVVALYNSGSSLNPAK